jgi:hypothetical protein
LPSPPSLYPLSLPSPPPSLPSQVLWAGYSTIVQGHARWQWRRTWWLNEAAPGWQYQWFICDAVVFLALFSVKWGFVVLT